MKKIRYFSLLPVYIPILACFLLLAISGSQVVAVLSVNAPVTNRTTVVIDAGHGGFDGGAVSCTGIYESQFNLEIALRLNDLMHLIGIDTVMIRDSDSSVHTSGETIAQKKISDLRERVRIVNETEKGLLLSIHQNYFSDSRYSGAQVFYAETEGSQMLARQLQSDLTANVNPNSNRREKKSTDVYLLEHICRTGVLIECGFLSNPEEEAMLRSKAYQLKLCGVIASSIGKYLSNT